MDCGVSEIIGAAIIFYVQVDVLCFCCGFPSLTEKICDSLGF